MAEIIPFPTERARPPAALAPPLGVAVSQADLAAAHRALGLTAPIFDLPYLPDGREGWDEPAFDFTGLQGDGGTEF